MRGLKNLLLKKPAICVFETTRKCNSKCTMCFIWERADNNEMELAQMKAVFLKLKKMGIYWVYVQGGEPLMHRHIKEMLLFLKDHFDVRLISNGIALNDRMQDFLIENKIGLTISLDTLDREQYHAIRGIEVFDKVMENIMRLGEKGYKDVTLHCTVSKLNVDQVFKIRQFAHDNGFLFTALPYISQIGFAGKENTALTYEQASLIQVFEKLKEEEGKTNFLLSLVYQDVMDYLSGKKIGKCDALTYSIYLTQEGMVAPCLEKKPYLDLKKEPAEKILGNTTQEKIVKTCYENTPCYYGCTREIHALSKNWQALLMHPASTLKSVRQYYVLKE